jgi:hypothetical protein
VSVASRFAGTVAWWKRSEASPAVLRRRGGLVLIIDAMLVGVGGVFLATTSFPVTVIAAISALVLTVVILTVGR